MTEYVYVRPRPGGRVRMPDRNFMPMDPAGATVPRIDYYERLILSGDVEITDAPVAERSSVDTAAAAQLAEASPAAAEEVNQSEPPRSAPRSTKET